MQASQLGTGPAKQHVGHSPSGGILLIPRRCAALLWLCSLLACLHTHKQIIQACCRHYRVHQAAKLRLTYCKLRAIGAVGDCQAAELVLRPTENAEGKLCEGKFLIAYHLAAHSLLHVFRHSNTLWRCAD